MKRLCRYWMCMMAVLACWTGVQAANGIIETRRYTICPGDVIEVGTMHKVTAHTDTVLFDTIHMSTPGTDSIYRYEVHLYPTFQQTEHRVLYAGQSLRWHGQTISTEGTFYDSHTNRHGCDSTYTLEVTLLTVPPLAKVEVTKKSICEGDNFEWRGAQHTLSGVYLDTTYIGAAIDSVFVLELTVNRVYEQTETFLSSSFPVLYRGQSLPAPGIYPFTYLSSGGCDSTINVIANYRTIPETHITRTICRGDSYTFGNTILTEAGTYRHTIEVDGFDSVVVLSLNVADVDTLVQVRRLNAGESYTWPANGQTYDSPGTYEVVGTNRFGCDSIVRLVLTVNHVDTIDTVATICPNETFVWHTIRASQSGHFEGAETDPHGDMKYYRLDLTVRELQERNVSFFICGDESISFNGKTYNQAGHYQDKVSCDTLYHILVSQKPSQVYQTDAYLDGVHPYTWTYWNNGTEETDDFDQPGTYEFTSPNDKGCNDVWRLVLSQDNNSYHFIEKVTLCEGEPYSWRGHSDLSGVPGETSYTEHLYTRSGNDSIYELQVKVLPIARSNKTITFCGSTTWKGTTYSASVIVYDTLTAANGCDSIVTVSLRHIDPFYKRDTATILQGEQLMWHGQLIQTDGVYYDYLQNQFGCDSVYELHVGIQATSPQTYMITTLAEICEGDYFEWRGKKYYTTGNFADTALAQTILEQDTIYALKLTVTPVDRRHEQYSFCEGGRLESIYGNDYNNLVATGEVFRDTITVPNSAHLGCPDTVYLEIYKYPKAHYTETVVLHPGEPIVWNGETITRAGFYTHHKLDGGIGGCGVDSTLRVIADMRKEVVICKIDTMTDTPDYKKYPYVWREDTFYTPGIWYDTVFNASHEIEQFYSLDLTIMEPYDTVVHVHGCINRGAEWRGRHYDKDTTFVERVETNPYTPKMPCDSVFHVFITIDPIYTVRIDTTLCEYQLPLLIGRTKVDTIWQAGGFRHADDLTTCGCDSIVEGNLTIIPKLTHNDSTFICENEIRQHPVWLGDTITPAFINNDGGKWADKWQGKWHGVKYTSDTIVWDCENTYFHHIIVRPSQKVPFDTTYLLCAGDSVQLFWPKEQWVKKDTVYYDTIASGYDWTDVQHGYTYSDHAHLCDSIIRWTVKFVQPEQRDTFAHRLLGDSIWWGGAWRYYTGQYDSISDAKVKNSDSIPCKVIYTLHLTMDTAYYFRDTVDICTSANKTNTYIWASGYEQTYTVSDRDSVGHHYVDSLITFDRRDSIYDLCVNYRLHHDTLLFDTICEGMSYRFNERRGTIERWLDKPGRYYDTVPALNGCDSMITLQLFVRDRVPVTHPTVHIPDTMVPYEWHHSWYDELGTLIDSTRWLYASGGYECRMYNRFGCDSIDSLTLVVYPTYHIQENPIVVCHEQIPFTWQDRNDITQSGDYTFRTLTKDGYDSIRYVHIDVQPVIPITLIVDTICENDSLRFGLTKFNQPRFLKKADIYYDTLISELTGCDSVIELRLNVYPVYRNYELVDISENELPYEWKHIQGGTLINSEMLNGSGEYVYYFTTSHGCDSIDSLSLRVHRTYNIVDEPITICSDQTPYTWHDLTNITTSGDYTFNGQTVAGYDSIHTVHIDVWPVKYTTITHAMCQGDTYVFGIKQLPLTEGGLYYDTLTAASGCDSIVTLVLKVQPIRDVTEKITIPEGESYTFWGTPYSQSGIYIHEEAIPETECHNTYTLILSVLKEHIVDLCEGNTFVYKNVSHSTNEVFYDTIPALAGGDSILKYTVRAHPTFDYIIERHISDKDTVHFHDRVLSSAGTYEWNGTTAYGCDSAEHLMLYVHPSYFFLDSVEICEPDTLFWHGQKITTSGLYYDSLVTQQFAYKFDSVYHLKVKAYPYYTFNEKYEIGDGEILKLHGRDISKPGEYWDTLYTEHGCDSIFHLVVNKKHTLEFNRTMQICQSETPLKWYDKTLTRSGNYTYTSQYKDSIVHLNLTVFPISISEKRIVITDKQAENGYIYGGRLYDDLPSVGKKVYADTLPNQYGCDSIVRLAIIVTQRYSEWTPIPLCPGGEVKIDGQVITEAGLYSFERRSKATGEMDSLYRVEVYNAPAFDLPVEKRVICDGDTTYFGGKAITRGGHYDFSLKTIDGCDSLIHLDLTVNPSYHFYQYATTPDYKPYNWQGKSYTQSGQYVRTWPTINDCDSTYTIDLTVIATQRDTVTESICVGQSFNWRGKQYDTEGYYTDTVWRPEANFSAIYGLRLIVVHPTTITSARTGEICADAESFDIYFTYDGEKPTHYSVYFDQLARREGFKDVIDEPLGADLVAHVAMPQFTSVVYQGHPYYVRPDYYTMRIALDNGVCGIYRSDSITLLVKYPSWILEQNWDDVVAPLKADYNGGYEFAQTDWYVNGVVQTNTPTGYLYSKELLPGDQVVMVATRKGETVAIPSCPLTIQTPAIPTYDVPVIVYPTQTPRQMPVITVEAPHEGVYEVFSATGMMMTSGKLSEGKTSITLPAINGIYFIRTYQGNEVTSHKVLLY